jgi:hypothetical protein
MLLTEPVSMDPYRKGIEYTVRHEQRRDELRRDAAGVGRTGRIVVGVLVGLPLLALMAYGVLGFLGIIEVPGVH